MECCRLSCRGLGDHSLLHEGYLAPANRRGGKQCGIPGVWARTRIDSRLVTPLGVAPNKPRPLVAGRQPNRDRCDTRSRQSLPGRPANARSTPDPNSNELDHPRSRSNALTLVIQLATVMGPTRFLRHFADQSCNGVARQSGPYCCEPHVTWLRPGLEPGTADYESAS